jgi:hypothetical protein
LLTGLLSQPASAQLPPPRDNPLDPLIPAPHARIPSAVTPSKPPTGYESPKPTSPVPELIDDVIRFTAGQIKTTFDDGKPVITTATCGVCARFRNIELTADAGTFDHQTYLGAFEGTVVFKVGEQEVKGRRIVVNFRTGAWSFDEAECTLEPQNTKGLLETPIFARGRVIRGIKQRSLIGQESEVTTCNLPAPHYELTAREFNVYPGNKIVFRDVTASAHGKKLFTLPKLVIPLRYVNRNPNFIPKFGQSSEEGFYVKSSYSFVGTRTHTAALALDLMSRKGVGIGITHSYQLNRGGGQLNLYGLHDRNISQNTLTGQFRHAQQFGTVKMDVTSELLKNTYLYAPDSQQFTNRIVLTRPRPDADTRFVIGESATNLYSRCKTITGNLHHNQNVGANTTLEAELDYLSFRFNDQTRSRLTSDLLFSRSEERFQVDLSAQKITDLTDEAFVGGGRFAGIERLPEIAFISDTARLGHVLPLRIPASFRLAYGQYVELPANIDLGRTYFEMVTPYRKHSFTKTWAYGLGAGFKQFIYSNSTAQYSVDTSAELSKQLGPSSKVALIYRYQRPRGFTPFRFDFVGKYNIANLQLNYQDNDRFKISLLGGYNFDQKNFPWQDITLRFSVRPCPSLLLYTATGYDINRSKWRALINQFRFRAVGDKVKVDVGTRYDTILKKLALVKTELDTPIDKHTRLQAISGYNGLTRQFDYRSFMLTRDLHCWEASLTYIDQGGFYLNRGFMINFRIKAFPMFRYYGMGNFGQALDTSVGQIY